MQTLRTFIPPPTSPHSLIPPHTAKPATHLPLAGRKYRADRLIREGAPGLALVAVVVPDGLLRQVGAAQHAQHNLPVHQHAQADRVLPHADKAAGAVDGVEHPVPPGAAALAAAEVDKVGHLARAQGRLLRGGRVGKRGRGRVGGRRREARVVQRRGRQVRMRICVR